MIVSDGTGNKIDEKVAKIIAQAHMRAIEILKDNIDKLHEISDFLLKEETITGDQFMEILNKKAIETDSSDISENTDVDVNNLENHESDESTEDKKENINNRKIDFLIYFCSFFSTSIILFIIFTLDK